MRLKCLPCLMNSLLASSKIKEQLPKKSVGLLSTNSQPTNAQQLATKWWTVGRESVNCWSTVYQQTTGRFLGSCSSILPIFHPFPSILAGFPLTTLHRICEVKESFNTVHTCCNDELLVLYNHYTHDISAEHLLICHHPIKQCIEKCFLNQK